MTTKSIPIHHVPRAAVEALVALYTTGNPMQIEHDDNIPAGPDTPEAQAHDAVEALRATGNSTSAVEAAIVAAGKGHARIAAKIAEVEHPR